MFVTLTNGTQRYLSSVLHYIFQWFFESLECGYCLEECNYVVGEGGEKETTPDDACQLDWSDRLNQFVVPPHVSSCLLDGCKVCQHDMLIL